MRHIKRLRGRTLISIAFAACLTASLFAVAACSPKAEAPAEKDTADAVEIDASSMGYVAFADGDAGNYPENYWTTDWNKDSARGCNACHEDLWDTVSDMEPLQHLASSDPGYGMNADWTDCYICHNGYALSGSQLNDMIHNIHYASDIFVSLGATCQSCHAINKNGEFAVYDFWKHSPDMGSFLYAGREGTVEWAAGRGMTTDTYAGVTVEHDVNVSNITFNQDPTAKEDRFRATNWSIYELTEDEWTLNVTGVKNPKAFTLAELKALPQTEVTLGHYCFVNSLGSYQFANIPYKGVLLEDIIEACGGLEDGIVSASVRGIDGWTFPASSTAEGIVGSGFDLDFLLEQNALIALEEWGEPMSQENGFPAVWCLPGTAAGGWLKWIAQINFSTEPGTSSTWAISEEYNEATNPDLLADETIDDAGRRGCINSGWLTPANDGDVLTMENGKVALSGYAYSWGQNGHQVKQIAFSADYGTTWNIIDVPESLDPLQLISWNAEWTPEKGAGTYELYVCAIDTISGWQLYPSAITVTVE